MVDGLTEVVPEDVETVRRIFQLYLEGYGEQAITNIPFKECVPSCLGGIDDPRHASQRKVCRRPAASKNYITDHIPESVVSIDEDAFACCSSLMQIAIRGNVTELGEGASYGCSSQTTVLSGPLSSGE